jgi:hypothetical protein
MGQDHAGHLNDAILRTAIDLRLGPLDLRSVCRELADYANAIEPSGQGRLKTRAPSRMLSEPLLHPQASVARSLLCRRAGRSSTHWACRRLPPPPLSLGATMASSSFWERDALQFAERLSAVNTNFAEVAHVHRLGKGRRLKCLRQHLISKICALSIITLVLVPFTAPFKTFGLAGPSSGHSHDGLPKHKIDADEKLVGVCNESLVAPVQNIAAIEPARGRNQVEERQVHATILRL